MLNRDRPLGQRYGDGYHFGTPDMANSRLPRAGGKQDVDTKRELCGWRNSIGMPFGRTGDKAVRRAMAGTVGLRHGRGPHAGWHLKPGKSKR
jgi:hypothetical protein